MSQKNSAGDLHQVLHNRSVQPDDDKIIHENEERYKTILENIEDGYFEVHLNGNITFFNDALCHILDRSRDDLTGMNYTEYMNDETADRVFKIFNRVYQTGVSAKLYDWEIITKDDARRIIDLSGNVMFRNKASMEILGYSVDGKAAKILERGCNGFIQKPFTMEQISSKVRKFLDNQ